MAEHELDEGLRGRLSALAEEASPELDELARRRVIAAVREEVGAARVESGLAKLADEASPSLSSAAKERVIAAAMEERQRAEAPPRRARWPIGVAFGVVAAAAAALFVLWPADPAPRAPTASSHGARACERWEPAGAALSRRGTAEGGGRMRVEAPDGCTTNIVLESGDVSVHARDLGGGVLRVLAGPATVEVRGTRFTVERTASAVSVAVTEGHVVVTLGDEPEVHLRGGDSWERRFTVTASAEILEPVPAPALDDEPPPSGRDSASPTSAVRRRGRGASSATPPEHARAPTAAERFALAERRWREGRRDEARALFREVGAGSGAIAQAAWVRLARLELRAGNAAAARAAARRCQRRFPSGQSGPEALYLVVQASRRLGDTAGEARAAARLRARYPDSPQADALGSP